MKSIIAFASLAIGGILLSAALVSAQPPSAGKGGGMYNPATETTLKGRVEAVTQNARGQMMGTHLTLMEGNQTRDIMLGPSSFITGKGFSFAKGDSLEVTGSKIAIGGTEYVVAREVVKDGKTLTLRDRNGIPQWAGGGMGRGRAK